MPELIERVAEWLDLFKRFRIPTFFLTLFVVGGGLFLANKAIDADPSSGHIVVGTVFTVLVAAVVAMWRGKK